MHLLLDCTLCANKYWICIYIYIYIYVRFSVHSDAPFSGWYVHIHGQVCPILRMISLRIGHPWTRRCFSLWAALSFHDAEHMYREPGGCAIWLAVCVSTRHIERDIIQLDRDIIQLDRDILSMARLVEIISRHNWIMCRVLTQMADHSAI